MDAASNGIDREYWGDRLEVNIELLAQRHADPAYLTAWVTRLRKRPRTLIADHLHIDAGQAIKDLRAELLGRPEHLLTAMLVEAAAAGKRGYAITEVSRSRLTEDDLTRCQLPNDKYDRLALMWLLHRQDPRNLELVCHLDRVQRKGFARMVLAPAPRSNGRSAASFFTTATIQRILDDHEAEGRTRRKSVCSEILHDGGGNFQVFVKRDLKSSFVSHGARNTFGFEPEWMVLEFEPDLHRVHMCSISPDVPVVLASRIAGRFFGVEVAYDNESIYTDASTVEDFLASLIDEPDVLPVVEVVAKNCGLRNAPQLRLNDSENRSLAPAISHFATAFGNPLDHVEDIESLKVHRFDKRVKIIFEQGEDEEELVVRYGDQPLTGAQRREFEELMLDSYGITVLSTEKRCAR